MISSLAVRIATVRALRGATVAGARAIDSMISPEDQTKQGAFEPLIVVYTEQDEGAIAGRDLLGAERSLELVLQCAVASVTTAVRQGGEGEPATVEVAIPHTDAGLESALDLLQRQAIRALLANDAPWADLWRLLVPRIKNFKLRRGASARKGTRFAVRELTLVCDVLADPGFGVAPDPQGPWGKFLELLRADPDSADLAGVIELELQSPNGWADWRQMQAALGLRYDEIRGIGLAPFLDHQETPTGPAAGLGEGIVDPNAVSTEDHE
jgi:hypothetical protein